MLEGSIQETQLELSTLQSRRQEAEAECARLKQQVAEQEAQVGVSPGVSPACGAHA